MNDYFELTKWYLAWPLRSIWQLITPSWNTFITRDHTLLVFLLPQPLSQFSLIVLLFLTPKCGTVSGLRLWSFFLAILNMCAQSMSFSMVPMLLPILTSPLSCRIIPNHQLDICLRHLIVQIVFGQSRTWLSVQTHTSPTLFYVNKFYLAPKTIYF